MLESFFVSCMVIGDIDISIVGFVSIRQIYQLKWGIYIISVGLLWTSYLDFLYRQCTNDLQIFPQDIYNSVYLVSLYSYSWILFGAVYK